jgi:hypothetical protein
MNEPRLTPDDPRLTAYALDELDAAERGACEAALRGDPALRAAVDGIREAARQLESALAAEEEPAPDAYRTRADRPGWFAFPRFYYVIGGLAAAGFAVMVAQYRETHDAKERRRTAGAGERTIYLELPLAPPEAASRPSSGAPARPASLDGYVEAARHPISTFSAAVDPAGGERVRRSIRSGELPAAGTVRIEELVNWFPYRTPAPVVPAAGGPALAAAVEAAESPWSSGNLLVRIGLRGREHGPREAAGATVADDVSVQVEFNPGRVARYRLVGYEEPASPPASADRAWADGVGFAAGQGFTALYEIVPVPAGDGVAAGGRLLTLRVRYREAGQRDRRIAEFALTGEGVRFAEAGADLRFAAAVARFGMILRDPSAGGRVAMDEVMAWAASAVAAADDPAGRREEFLELARTVRGMLQ